MQISFIFSGADLAALVREASVAALRDHFKKKFGDGTVVMETVGEGAETKMDCALNQEHFEMAFSKVKPSVNLVDRERYSLLEKKYGC